MAKNEKMAQDASQEEKKNNKSSNRSRSRGRNRNSGADSAADRSTRDAGGGYKSVSSAITNIINASASVAVRNVAGNRVFVNPSSVILPDPSAARVQSTGNYRVPGVYAVTFAPLFGRATGIQTDPVNLAARNMWMNLRSLYSNRIPYTAGAIVKYSMALDSLLTAFQWVKRAYGVVFAYDVRNRYVPDALLKAMGLDYQDFRANLPDIKVFLNKLASQLSVFGVPTELRFILDHIDATAHIYMDDETSTAQYIVYSPEFYWKMNWAEGKLESYSLVDYNQLTDPTATLAPWSTVRDRFTALVEAFVNNEDVYMIASDMMRLYGNLAGIGPVDSTYMIGPEVDPVQREIWHNSTYPVKGMFTHTTASSRFQVTENQAPENVGAITASYCTGFQLNPSADSAWIAQASTAAMHVYDFDNEDPTTEQFVRCSNWRYLTTGMGAGTGTAVPIDLSRVLTCGTLAMARIVLLFMHSYTGEESDLRIYGEDLTLTYGADERELTPFPPESAPYARNLFRWTGLSIWNQHPLAPQMRTFSVTGSGNARTINAEFTMPYGELDHYVTLSADELQRIHDALILDKFDATGIGTLNLRPKG